MVSLQPKHAKTGTLALATLACAALPVFAQAEGVTIPNPQTFNEMLAQDYSNFAKLERGDDTDMIDAHKLSDRALSAFHGNVVMPLAPSQVRIVRVTPQQLESDYTRIKRVVTTPQIVQAHPAEVAQAQAAYDCYALHQQSEPNASHNLHNVCEPIFRNLIAKLDQPVQTTQVVTKVKRYVAVDTKEVRFAWDKAELSPEAKQTLDNVKAMMQDGKGQLRGVALEGFADRSGPTDYNQRLSQRRVKAVEDYLGTVSVNLNDVDFQSRAYGETNLPVPTADGVRDPRNRVVKVAVVESAKKVEKVVEQKTTY